MHKHVVRNAKARGAVCNDGNPATFYYRGCNNTYYLHDAGGCVNISSEWVVHFGTSPTPYCSDEASCQHRNRTDPLLVSPAKNSTTIIDGLLQPYPESNANFYKAHTVYVPYCSSDLWLGNSTSKFGFQFKGRNILKAVIEDLLYTPETGTDDDGETEDKLRYNLTGADQLVFSGGPGFVAQSSLVNSLLPSALRRKSTFVCDGCVLVNTPPLVSVHTKPCTSILDCPLNVTLKAGWKLWGAPALTCEGAEGEVKGAADSYGCLFMPQLLSLSKGTPVMYQHPYYDAAQLRMLRAWPYSNSTAAYIEQFASMVRKYLQSTPFAYGAGCSTPYQYVTNHIAYYYTKVGTSTKIRHALAPCL
jgi:hypothetical protein